VARSIAALRKQFDQDFEIVVAVDSREEDYPAALLDSLDLTVNGKHPVIVPSHRRPGNFNVPHRNHARNAGCCAARGEYVWPIDCDLMPDPNAVAHLKELVRKSDKPVTLSPCLAEPDCSPAEWMTRTPGNVGSVHQWTPSGYLHLYQEGPASSIHMPDMPEGQPAFPKWLWEALGGFDERFLAWGGNKIELCRRFCALDAQHGLIEVRLLNSCLFIHQPHPKDPLHFNKVWRRKNTAFYAERRRDLSRNAPWWQTQVAAVQQAMAELSGN